MQIVLYVLEFRKKILRTDRQKRVTINLALKEKMHTIVFVVVVVVDIFGQIVACCPNPTNPTDPNLESKIRWSLVSKMADRSNRESREMWLTKFQCYGLGGRQTEGSRSVADKVSVLWPGRQAD